MTNENIISSKSTEPRNTTVIFSEVSLNSFIQATIVQIDIMSVITQF
jgi:hypothetical protein